jgi:hypothetical protein
VSPHFVGKPVMKGPGKERLRLRDVDG